ncbi:MAG: PadR family transcriptional regulator [Anaerolineae bacterium]|nr:PadR family transcriptional regulator [Anaerolineae bacterium]
MTDAELAVLSIVAEGPIHGYDIQTVIEQRGLRAWTNIGVSSMYYVLEKLVHQGLIESTGPQGAEDLARRQFRITAAGFGVLQTAVADLLSTPRESVDGFELGLANLHVLRPSQIRTAFIAYRQELVSRLAQTQERWQQLKTKNAPFNVDAMLGHHAAMLEAELEWVITFIKEWEIQAPPDEEPDSMPEVSDIPRMKQVILPHDPDSPHRLPTRPLNPPLNHARSIAEAETDLNLQKELKQTPFGTRTPPVITQDDVILQDDSDAEEFQPEDDASSLAEDDGDDESLT